MLSKLASLVAFPSRNVFEHLGGDLLGTVRFQFLQYCSWTLNSVSMTKFSNFGVYRHHLVAC